MRTVEQDKKRLEGIVELAMNFIVSEVQSGVRINQIDGLRDFHIYALEAERIYNQMDLWLKTKEQEKR